MTFTYDEKLYSDLYKDAYGSRPSSGNMAIWEEMGPTEKQNRWDMLLNEMAERLREEKLEENRAIDRFEYWINNTIESGAKDRSQALEWILTAEKSEDPQFDVEHFEWQQGLPFGYLNNFTLNGN
jgi:hypothetical protein